MNFLFIGLNLIGALLIVLAGHIKSQHSKKKLKQPSDAKRDTSIFVHWTFLSLALAIIGTLLNIFAGELKSHQSQIQFKRDLDVTKTELIQKNQKIEELNNFILSSITGGDSYCYVQTPIDMSGFLNFSLVHVGKFPLYDVNVIIHDMSKRGELAQAMGIPTKGSFTRGELDELQKQRDLIGESIKLLEEDVISRHNWPSFPPGSIAMPFLRCRLPVDKQEQQYLVKIYARNGTITQPIRFIRVAGQWEMSMRVQKYDSLKLKFTELRNKLHPNVPLKETYAGE
jgi:hypothetical protein